MKKAKDFCPIDVFAADTGQEYDESMIDSQPKGTYYERSKQLADQFVVVKLIASFGEWLAGMTNKPPLIPKGQLHFLQWQARPQSKKARQELGWSPTPLREGLSKTISFLLGDARRCQ